MFSISIRSCCKSLGSEPDAHSKKMQAGNGNLYTLLGFLFTVGFVIHMFFGELGFHSKEPDMSLVGRDKTHFIVDGRAFYVNWWNSYWLMDKAVEDSNRPRVSTVFKAGAEMGLTVCRTWAFNNGTHNALQVSLGQFDEHIFKALDRVTVEARRYGIQLILCLVNNLQAFGGKTQYVKWAAEMGIGLSPSNDSFFFDPVIRSYFKFYLETILTRKNPLNGIEYRDDPTIFAWELMNEPQCMTAATGDTLQVGAAEAWRKSRGGAIRKRVAWSGTRSGVIGVE